VSGGGAGFYDVAPDAWYLNALEWALDEDVVTGYSDGTFRPGEPMNRAQAVSWLWLLAGQPAAGSEAAFDDVGRRAWYGDALDWAIEADLVTGFPDDTFRPMSPVNRAQLASMMWHLAGEPTPDAGPSFSDLNPNAWFATAVAWLTEAGYASGFGDGTFHPRDPVTRAQAVSWLYASHHA
jgi:hypothetical protein